MNTHISKIAFKKLLNSREVEDLKLIATVEKFLKKKRGYVLKIPKKGESVILLLSGGLDSVVAWESLINWYDCIVYPVYINRGKKRRVQKEWRSIRYFANYFRNKYPGNFKEPFNIKVNTLPKDYSKYFTKVAVSSEEILSNFVNNNSYINDGSNVLINKANNIDPYITPFYGVMYAQYLELSSRVKVRHIFVGTNSSDSISGTSQSLTALRSTLLGFCAATATYDWSLSSVFFEKEFGVALNKTGVITLGSEFNLPMEKTWSCFKSGLWQCGDACTTCDDRKNAFASAGLVDKTFYTSSIKSFQIKIFNKLKKLIKLSKNYILGKK